MGENSWWDMDTEVIEKIFIMKNQLIKELHAHAKWAHTHEHELPATLGDDLDAAVEMIESLNAELERIKRNAIRQCRI